MTQASYAKRPAYYGYWLIVAAFVAQFVAVGVTNYVAGPFLTPMTEELGWTRAEYTIPRSLGGFIMAVTGFFIGAWVDRYGGRPFMVGGVTLVIVSLWMQSTVTTLTEWILINGVLITVGAALMGNLVVNVTMAKWFVEFRGRAVALAAMGVSFAGITITPVMIWVIDAWGWRHAWELLAVGAAVITYPVALMMRRAPEDIGLHPDGKSDADLAAGRAVRAELDYANSMTRREALQTGSFYLLIVAFGMFTVNIGVMLLQTVPYMTDAGYDRSTAANMIVITSVPAMLAKPIWGYFIDRLDPRPLAAGGSAVTGGALLVIVAAVTFESLPWIYAGFFLLGSGWGGMISLQEVIWASFFGRRYLGAVRSAALPFSLLIGSGAPLAVSYYYDVVGNYDGAFLTVAASNLIAALLILAIRPPSRSRQ